MGASLVRSPSNSDIQALRSIFFQQAPLMNDGSKKSLRGDEEWLTPYIESHLAHYRENYDGNEHDWTQYHDKPFVNPIQAGKHCLVFFIQGISPSDNRIMTLSRLPKPTNDPLFEEFQLLCDLNKTLGIESYTKHGFGVIKPQHYGIIDIRGVEHSYIMMPYVNLGELNIRINPRYLIPEFGYAVGSINREIRSIANVSYELASQRYFEQATSLIRANAVIYVLTGRAIKQRINAGDWLGVVSHTKISNLTLCSCYEGLTSKLNDDQWVNLISNHEEYVMIPMLDGDRLIKVKPFSYDTKLLNQILEEEKSKV